MAVTTGERGSTIYFILGALVVAVGVLGWLYFENQDDSVKLEITVPDVNIDTSE